MSHHSLSSFIPFGLGPLIYFSCLLWVGDIFFNIPFILCVDFLVIPLFLVFALEITINNYKSLCTTFKSHYASFYTVSVSYHSTI